MTNPVQVPYHPPVASLAPPLRFGFPNGGTSLRENMILAAQAAVDDLRKDFIGNKMYAWCNVEDAEGKLAEYKEDVEAALALCARYAERLLVKPGISPKGNTCLVFYREFYVPERVAPGEVSADQPAVV